MPEQIATGGIHHLRLTVTDVQRRKRRVTAEGLLSVEGRRAQCLVIDGRFVGELYMPPAELEAVLLRHPDITDAAVVGLPDEQAGEIPVGYVTLRPGVASGPEEIRQFVAGQVASYKQLRRWK